MKKTLLKSLLAVALLLVCGNVWGQDVVCYTLTPTSGSNNSYAGNCDVTIDGIIWNITGNSQMNPWRVGGKSITNEDRPIFSRTAISDNVTKIVVSHGTVGITVISFKLDVYSTAALCEAGAAGDVSTLTGTVTANTECTFTRPAGHDWTDRFYRFTYNVTNDTKNNKWLEFSSATFYKMPSGKLAPELAYAETAVSKANSAAPFTNPLTNPNTLSPIVYASSLESVATVDTSGEVSIVGAGITTITASFAGNDTYDPGVASYDLQVYEPNIIDFSLHGYANAEVVTSYIQDDVTVSFTKGGSNDPKYYNSGQAVRFYSGGTMTISVPVGKKITRIEFFDSTLGLEGDASPGHYENNVWTGSARSVVFTAGAQCRVKKISLTYGAVTDLDFDLTVTAAGWATAYLPFDAELTTTGATAYYITGVSGGALTMAKVTGVIPANEGVLVSGSEGTITFVEAVASASDQTAANGNMLEGTTETGGATFNAANTTYYILTNGNDGNGGGNGIGFYYQVADGASVNCAQYKAVLVVPGSSGAIGYRLDGTTLVDQMLQENHDAAIYDLQGRQVENVTKGLYIVGGKKVLVK